MSHMPDDRRTMGNGPQDATENAPSKDAASWDYHPHTPQSAEGLDGEEREVPQGEPGPTPGSAEGEDFDEPSRR
ncbi:hypothetical protein [Cystobacter ferrugineus]|nr:hypothetical protein [Cystobacter ferrugineus]